MIPVIVPPNLVPDGTFESGMGSWSTSSATTAVSTDWANSGTQSARLVVNVGGSGDLRKGSATAIGFGLEPGKTYSMQAVCYAPVAATSYDTGAGSRQRRILVFFSTNGSSFVQEFGPQAPNGSAGRYELSHTFTVPVNATGAVIAIGAADPTAGFVTYIDDVVIREVGPLQYGTPVGGPQSVEEALYGDRVTSYRWEVLEHSNGIDKLVGTLDGVADGSLTWVQNAAVKGSGNIEVIALDAAQPGMLRISDLSLESVRLRPVCTIQGLPENPLGVFLVAAATEDWQSTGRVWSLELLDRTTVPSQDFMEESYAVAAGTPILKRVQQILASSGEYMAIDESNSVATSTGMTWEAGTSKLKIINDLLDVAGYNSLWMDGYGDLQATPRVLPANRSLTYDLLGIPRELQDGQTSIYSPDWTRDRDSFEVPNKVIAIQAAGGEDEAALVGTWTNTDPASPYSYPSRGRWIPHVLDSVETPEGTAAQTLEFLRNRARATLVQMSAVQAEIKITHLPIPIRVSDVLRFVNSKAQVDGRYVVTRIKLDTTSLGLMSSTLQEVISL